jgi:membrane protein DedA with SNARE-associated domain
MSHVATNLPSVITSIEPFVKQYGYLGVSFLLLLENTGIPIPGETTLIAAAVFAGLGQLNILIVIFIAIIACVLGDSISFLIGSLGGKWIIDRYGKYVGLNAEKYAKAEAFFEKRGGIVVIVARFFEGLRQLNGFIAGSSSMKWPKFVIFNIIGSSIWVTTWALIGYYSGNHIATLLKYQTYFSIIFGVFVVFLALWFLIKRRKNKKYAR